MGEIWSQPILKNPLFIGKTGKKIRPLYGDRNGTHIFLL